MPRYIEEKKAFEVLTDYYHQRTEIQHLALIEALHRVPTADVVERKKGKWKQGHCSECGYNWGEVAPFASVPNYCPNCGAEMKGEDDA